MIKKLILQHHKMEHDENNVKILIIATRDHDDV
jgi:hypothetical protein